MAASIGLANLLRQSTIDDHEELLKAANAALKTSKNDLEAQHVKAVALLKLDRYDEAVHILESGGDKLKTKAALEYAYALYKTGKPSEAVSVAEKGGDRGSRHVEAQARYRREDFKRAAELYAQLASETGEVSNEDVDLRINSSAVDAQLEWANLGHLARSRKPGREDLEAFETAYNAACGSIARGELAQAEVLLKRSKDLCNALDDLSKDEKRAELLPITVQQVYVLTRLGRNEEAKKISEGVSVNEILDHTSKSIARINSLAASGADNPFMLQRLIQTSTKIPPSDKPFGFQAAALRRNENAVALSAQKFDGVIRSSKSSAVDTATLDPSVNSFSTLNAAAQARYKSGKEALKLILPELEKRPKDVGLILVIVQLYVLTGNNDTATFLLEKFLERLEQSSAPSDVDARYAPGLIGTITALYKARGQASHIRTEFAKAAKYWRHKSKDSPESRTPSILNLFKTAIGALIDSPSQEDRDLVRSILTDINASDSSDPYLTAAVIASAADNESDIDPKQVSTLTPVERLTTGIDTAALEEAGIARPPQPKTTTATSAKRPAETSAAPKKAKKIKPSKTPKDYDPNKQPDPERWLPLRDRSTYRPKGKKGKQRANMLAQGAVEETSRPGTPQQGEVQKAGGGGGKQQQKKKKGKGGKW